MVRYEKLLLERRSDLCLVVGDVTSTMACAIAAQKLGRIGVGFELRKDLFRECIIKNITNNECQLEEIEIE
jgi:hypothetical protein